MKIAFLKPEEKNNPNHPLFEKLKELRSEYASSLIIERESEIYGEHKRK